MAKKNNVRRSNSSRRNAVRLRVKSWRRACALCGEPIDYSLPAGHPLSFEVDEIVPVSKGGSPFAISNCQPAHRICNELRGNMDMDTWLAKRKCLMVSARTPALAPNTSTGW